MLKTRRRWVNSTPATARTRTWWIRSPSAIPGQNFVGVDTQNCDHPNCLRLPVVGQAVHDYSAPVVHNRDALDSDLPLFIQYYTRKPFARLIKYSGSRFPKEHQNRPPAVNGYSWFSLSIPDRITAPINARYPAGTVIGPPPANRSPGPVRQPQPDAGLSNAPARLFRCALRIVGAHGLPFPGDPDISG